MGGGGIALTLLVSDFRRSLHVNRYLNRTVHRFEDHRLILALARSP